MTVYAPPGGPPVLAAEVGADPVSWVDEHRDLLGGVLAEQGAVLVRGLGVREPAELAGVLRRVSPGGPLAERESFAPRRSYAEGVYSSSSWPANQPMCMHHELSYRLEFPGLLLFACRRAPDEGGATGVADAASVLTALPADLVARFEREGWLLLRNYTGEIGASISEAFGTDDPDAVERYCRANAIEFEWGAGGALRTWQRRAAVLRHPVSGQRCWFNQIAFLSEWTLDPELREYLVDVYGADGLPFNTFFGGGEPISDEMVQTINEVYHAHTRREPWRDGDLLLVDNIRCAHSREPFTGPREVLVGLADPVRLPEDAATGSAS